MKWYFIRHRRGHGKATAVELADMADSDSVDSKEKQEIDTSVDNVCYAKIPSKEGSGKNAAVELVGVVDKGCVNSKGEQDINVSVENVCYEKIKRGSEKDAVVETVMVDKGSVDCKEQDMGTSVDNVCYDKLESK